jgi:hypothetical protein
MERKSDFLIIFQDLLRHFSDYRELKTVQQSSSALNALFTCPSQIVWRRLCQQQQYTNLLDRTSLRTRQIWELLYYQNWKVDKNWLGAIFILALLECGTDALHKRPLRNQQNAVMADLRPNRHILSFINGGASYALSFALELCEGFVLLWDLKRGIRLDRRRSLGAISSYLLHKNTLILGKNDGTLQICSFLKDPVIIKHHPTEVTAIIAGTEDSIISADSQGNVLQCKLDGAEARVLYRHPEAAISALLYVDGSIIASSITGHLIKLTEASIHVYYFHQFGAINCLCKGLTNSIVAGTDSGTLLYLSNDVVVEVAVNASVPITAISCDGKRLAVGCFDGTVAVYQMPRCDEILRFRNHLGPIWSVGIDACCLLTSSLDGTVLSRNFF